MGNNIFFCNGIISVLAANLICEEMQKKNIKSTNYLCIEKNSSCVDFNYYEIVDLLINLNVKYEKIIKLDIDHRVMNLRKPLQFFKNIRYYKKYYLKVKKILGNELDVKNLNVWACSTTNTWPFFIRAGAKFRLIEHGMGEYVQVYLSSSAKKNFKIWLKNKVRRALGYVDHGSYSEAWLCSDQFSFDKSSNVIQLDVKKSFEDHVDKFWNLYQEKYIEETAELLKLKQEIIEKNEDTYLYLISDEIKDEFYEKFFKWQLDKLNLNKNSVLLIKSHPSMKLDHTSPYIKKHVFALSINSKLNSYIPAEFLIRILNLKGVIGTFSSTLYYTKTWMPEVKVYITDEVDLFFIKDEWRLMTSQLKAMKICHSQTRGM